MKRSRVFLLVTSGLLGGCAGMPLFGNLDLNPNAGLVQGAPLGSDFTSVSKGKIEGSVAVPTLIAHNSQALNADKLNSSSLIANNANALVGNNANALVGNNANALVGNNASTLTGSGGLALGFHVAGVESQPVEKMFVAAFNEKLSPVSALTLTDASGKFSLSVPPGVVLIEAVRGSARQLGLAYSDAKQVSIDFSSTLVAAQMQATGKFASYPKADVDALVAEVAKSDSADPNVLLRSDADLKTQFDSITGAKTLFERILAGNSATGGSDGSGGNGTNTTGGNGTGTAGGSGTKTPSTIAVSTWPETNDGNGNYVKAAQDDVLKWIEINRAEGNATLAMATHNGASIKKDDVVAFKMKVTGSSMPQVAGKFPGYLKFLRSDGTVVSKIGVYFGTAPAGEAVGACSSSLNAYSCAANSGGFVPFKFTVPDSVDRLEFGGETTSYTSQLTQIDVNP